MEGKIIEASSDKGKPISRGLVLLVYKDAIASGTNEYVEITMLSVLEMNDPNRVVHNVRPRDVYKILL